MKANGRETPQWQAIVSSKEPSEQWPGQRAGIRPPETYETPLSDAEVRHAVKHGLCKE